MNQSLVRFSCYLLLLLTVAGLSLAVTDSNSRVQTAVEFGTVDSSLDDINNQSLANYEVLPKSVVFTGDVMLGRHVEKIITSQGADYVMADMVGIATTSAWVGNFEGAIAPVHRPTPDGGMTFAIATTSLAAIDSIPFTHFSLANNHSYDQGESGFRLTKNILSQFGYTPFGDWQLGSTSVSYISVEGGTIGLIALYALYELPPEEQVAALVAAVSEASDIQVVYVHWGEEYTEIHNAAQRALAVILSNLGVEAVIGHHPHVVQDIELIGDTLVVYSLGNFVFDQYFSDEVETGMLVEMVLQEQQIEYRLWPVSSQGSWSRPRLLPAYNRDRFLRALANKSTHSLRPAIEAGVITQQIQ